MYKLPEKQRDNRREMREWLASQERANGRYGWRPQGTKLKIPEPPRVHKIPSVVVPGDEFPDWNYGDKHYKAADPQARTSCPHLHRTIAEAVECASTGLGTTVVAVGACLTRRERQYIESLFPGETS